MPARMRGTRIQGLANPKARQHVQLAFLRPVQFFVFSACISVTRTQAYTSMRHLERYKTISTGTVGCSATVVLPMPSVVYHHLLCLP